MLKALYANAERRGIPIAYETPAVSLMREGGRVTGVVAEQAGAPVAIKAGAVVLACGSFESNPEMRARYLGPGWELAKVRGTRFNMGAGVNMALAIGARPYGHWSGCHSVAWDVNAPPYGDLTVGDQFQKHNYPFGIIVNARGERYVDEGLNFHSHTYAKYGAEIVKQPGMFAWQVFDAKASPLLRGEYRIRRVTKAEAGMLEELAPKLEGVDAQAFLRTVREFNAACRCDVPFNPNILDGRRTEGLAIDKTNWANPLDTPPFHAYHVTTGVTFTFGGVKISQQGSVEDLYGRVIPGLYAAGEMVGGLFFHNYASGTGLMSGATFGRLAGRRAAQFVQGRAAG
jgi:tricarballylate dehydrogenase